MMEVLHLKTECLGRAYIIVTAERADEAIAIVAWATVSSIILVVQISC